MKNLPIKGNKSSKIKQKANIIHECEVQDDTEDNHKVLVRMGSCDGRKQIDVSKVQRREWRRCSRKTPLNQMERNPVVRTQENRHIKLK